MVTLTELAIGTQSTSRYATLALGRMVLLLMTTEVLWASVVSMLVLSSTTYCIASTLTTSCTVIVATTIPMVLCYTVVLMVETSVHPYDVLESEPELVSGYYVDYGGVAFVVIYLGEGVSLTMLLCVLLGGVAGLGPAVPLAVTMQL